MNKPYSLTWRMTWRLRICFFVFWSLFFVFVLLLILLLLINQLQHHWLLPLDSFFSSVPEETKANCSTNPERVSPTFHKQSVEKNSSHEMKLQNYLLKCETWRKSSFFKGGKHWICLGTCVWLSIVVRYARLIVWQHTYKVRYNEIEVHCLSSWRTAEFT